METITTDADQNTNSTLMVPEPPAPITPSPNLVAWPTDLPLHRVWNKKYAGHEFNPGVGAPTRFAPIKTVRGTPIPTLYASNTQQCAFYERIFHDVPLAPAGLRTVHVNSIAGLVAGSVIPTRTLSLAQLFRPDLERWGLKRSELVHCEAEHYLGTAKWAAALHSEFAHLDGLIWTSNRCDPALAVVLFGDRCADDIVSVDGAEEILTSATLLKVLNDCAERANIRIVYS